MERAELIAVGTELTVGETRDTNSGDVAQELTALGVVVDRLTALRDDLAAVVGALVAASARSDLVVTTGGLGPTPDDLTREAIAAATGRTVREDPELLAWLSGLFERRGLPMADANRKQSWIVDGARALPNRHGTAPGWWVERPDGGLIVALPGPPRELRPMWREEVLPRLRERGMGVDRAVRTLRLTGIGESALAELIGEARLRERNPEVATYAREDAVDVRISASAPREGTGGTRHTARELVDATVGELLPMLGPYVFAHDHERWTDALGARLGERSLAAVEIGTAGALAALIGDAPFLRFLELVAPGSPLDDAHGQGVEPYAVQVRDIASADVGLAVRVRERGNDMAVHVALALTDDDVRTVTRTAFMGGAQGRRRAAIVACAELWRMLGG